MNLDGWTVLFILTVFFTNSLRIEFSTGFLSIKDHKKNSSVRTIIVS